MKLLFAGFALAAVSLAVHTAEAKGKKVLVPQNKDRSMTALPYSSIPETPPFRWSGRSSWGRPVDNNQFPNESANGS